MIKRAVSFAMLGLGVVVLGGCPIYPDDSGPGYDPMPAGCQYDSDCGTGYRCDHSNYDHPGQCVPKPSQGRTCDQPSDCYVGETCSSSGQCVAGDCSQVGCVSPYLCKLENGKASCVPPATGIASKCKSDADCSTPAGSKCLSGSCVAPENQCADASQCPSGASCVAGSCTPTCDASRPCPTGYACDAAKGVCSENPKSCGSSAECSGGTVCVDQHCVAPCDVAGKCGPGLLCVDGGCTPDEKPVFVCDADGVQDRCQPGSICLRHSCYIACDADGGADICKNADKFNVCKPVTTSSGTHSVCGSASNLGTECDPTQNKNCAAGVCIDGYCK